MKWSLIIPAAGSGSRFGGETPKQFLPLKGRPLIAHTIERFLEEPDLDEIVVAIASERLVSFRGLLLELGWSARVEAVEGGHTRQRSVLRALSSLRSMDGVLVAVHDAVRPFVRSQVLHAALKGAEHVGACLPAVALTDTIHKVTDRMVVDTPPREQLVAAQTPQCFRAEILLDILQKAERDGVTGTDEAGLAAHYGYPVRVVEGDVANFKITRPEDWIAADANFDAWRVR